MIMFQNLMRSQYQVYDASIMELGYPPTQVLKSLLQHPDPTVCLSDYYAVNGASVKLDYTYTLDQNDVSTVYKRAAEWVQDKRYLYYFGGIVMCDASGMIRRATSSCYRLTPSRKMISVTEEEIPITTETLDFCIASPLPQIKAGAVMQYLSDHCKSLVRDETGLRKLGFVQINSSTFAASQKMDAGDLYFIVQLNRGRSLLLLTMKYEDLDGLLRLRRR